MGLDTTSNNTKDIFIGPPKKVASRIARLLVMKQDNVLSERKSWSNLTITIIKGTCDVVCEEISKRLCTGDVFRIDPNKEHFIKSLTHLRAVVSFDTYCGFENGEEISE